MISIIGCDGEWLLFIWNQPCFSNHQSYESRFYQLQWSTQNQSNKLLILASSSSSKIAKNKQTRELLLCNSEEEWHQKIKPIDFESMYEL